MSEEPFPVVRVAHAAPEAVEPAWLVRDLWGAEAVGFIGGTPKSCKTWLALELAVAVASGRPCLGHYPVVERGPVVLYAAEDSAAAIRTRVSGITRARKLDLERLAVGLITEPSIALDRLDHQTRLLRTVRKNKAKLLILDPLVRLHHGDENSAADTSALLAFLRHLQRETHTAIAVVHHIRKSGSATQPGQGRRGSGDLHAWSDSNLFVLHGQDGLELHSEHRNHPAPDPLALRLERDPPHLVVAPMEQGGEPDEVASRVVEALANGPLGRTELRSRVRIRNERLGQILEDLTSARRVARDAEGRWCVPRSGD
ncbi:MAG: AAA family ATPase [Gemmatimonadota bacterium]|nr:AAA family ATPase [Gemmatimonadota bacterium]